MKKFIHLMLLWAMAVSLNAQNNCQASIGIDSTNVGAVVLVAYPGGTSPFSYLWSTGETTQSIIWFANGVNYCVSITDANGCVATACLFSQNTCSVSITASPASGLTANASGVAPFSYLWSNGSTNGSIQPNTPGTFCVTTTDATGCDATSCTWWGSQPDSCGVYIVMDSLNTGGGVFFTAIANGTAPFAYQWNLGQTTQSVPLDPAYFGDYCVTVTDANGCISTDCIFMGNNGCSVWIFESDTIGMVGLYAIASVPANVVNYLWNTGETGAVIFPTTAGTYCVTITGGGCTASACYNNQTASNYSISGYLYLPDSTTNATVLAGTVELYFNAPNTNVWESVATTDIESNPNGWSNFYSFGVQNSAGQYLVKATLDPNLPFAADYLPTYHFNTVYWDEANLINLPSNGSGLFNVILSDGQNLTGGSGNIGGTVTEGDGFTANGDGNRGGAPIEGVTILLLDSNEQPITHDLTDANGAYSFGNLPFGTYKVVVEIVGKEQAGRWVTLTGDNPTSSGNDFEVTESGIVSGISDLVAEGQFSVFPNPSNDLLNIQLESADAFEAQISLTNLAGSTVFTQTQTVAKGNQQFGFEISNLPAGMYFLQVATGREVISTKIVKE